jgi:MoaA/NifB/PqqE/SkfB family radical SAM enzyme
MARTIKNIAVLNITSRCNLRCPFCFGPEVKSKTNNQETITKFSTEIAKNNIVKLYKNGARILIFSGGEPLLRPDIWELICYAKKQGFFTMLHTNGILFYKKFKAQNLKLKNTSQKLKIGENNSLTAVTPNTGMTPAKALQCLNQINLPLDGYNTKTNDAMRGRGHFKAIMAALRLLKDKKIRVIISTVVMAKNKNAVVKISKILPKWIFKWRIFQFNPQGKAATVKKEFEIGDREFEKIKKGIYRLKPELQNIKVQCVSLKDRKFWESYNTISNL